MKLLDSVILSVRVNWFVFVNICEKVISFDLGNYIIIITWWSEMMWLIQVIWWGEWTWCSKIVSSNKDPCFRELVRSCQFSCWCKSWSDEKFCHAKQFGLWHLVRFGIIGWSRHHCWWCELTWGSKVMWLNILDVYKLPIPEKRMVSDIWHHMITDLNKKNLQTWQKKICLISSLKLIE